MLNRRARTILASILAGGTFSCATVSYRLDELPKSKGRIESLRCGPPQSPSWFGVRIFDKGKSFTVDDEWQIVIIGRRSVDAVDGEDVGDAVVDLEVINYFERCKQEGARASWNRSGDAICVNVADSSLKPIGPDPCRDGSLTLKVDRLCFDSRECKERDPVQVMVRGM